MSKNKINKTKSAEKFLICVVSIAKIIRNRKLYLDLCCSEEKRPIA